MLKFIYDPSGNVVSQTAENVVLTPQIIGQPVSTIIEPGQIASFSVVVSDGKGVTFQWMFNGTDIPESTNDSLLLTNVAPANEGLYSVVLANSAGSITSAPAALMLDSDLDGLPDKWEIEKFSNLTIQHSEGDPDHDGISNIDEFLDSTNPNSNASLRPRLVVYSDIGGSVTVNPININYELGELATLTAISWTPSRVFVGWAEQFVTGDILIREFNTGDLVSTTNPITFAINKNKIIRARFASALPLPLPQDLVASWRGENNMKDVINRNNGIMGTEISFGIGKVGKSFIFSGSAIKILASDTLNVGIGNGFTLEAWIKPIDSRTRYPLFEWNDGSRFGVHLWISESFGTFGGPGSLFANIVDTTNRGHVFSSKPDLIRDNIWQHIAVTYDRNSGICILFLNGLQVGSMNIGFLTPLTTSDLYLGHRPGDVSYSGMIDEPTIYNRVLTIEEIFNIYNADFLGKDFESPYFTSNSQLPDGIPGIDYSHQLMTIFGVTPITFSLSNGRLPSGLTLSTTGLINGIPTLFGTFSFTVLATDAMGLSREQMCILRIIKPVALTSDVVAWWRAEPAAGSVVLDSIGSHNGSSFRGNVSADTVYTPNGKVQSAFEFDGTSYIQIGDSSDLHPEEITIEAWVFPTLLNSDHQTIISRGSSVNDDNAWWMGLFNGKPRFWSKHLGSPMQLIEAPSAIPLNQWTHLVISFDRSVKRMYVNGIQVNSKEGLGPIEYDRASVPITIGSDWAFNHTTERFKGLIDEVTFYRRALSHDEIFNIMDAGSAGKLTTGPYINSPSILPLGIVDQLYTHTFTTVRGVLPIEYSISPDSTLPAGLILDSLSGILNGTPLITGTYNFKIHAKDSSGILTQQYCTLKIFKSIAVLSGIISWWKGDGNAQDVLGNNHGILQNGVAFSTGKVDQTFSLDGINDFIEIPDTLTIRPVSVTLEAWVLFNTTSGIRIIFSKPVGSDTSDSYGLWLQDGTLRGAVGDASGIGAVLIFSNFLPIPGRWYHLAYTFDDVTKKQALYVNGAKVSRPEDENASKSIGYDNQSLFLGRDTENGSPNFFLHGLIDEAAIYNRALSPMEIMSIYIAGPGGKRL